MLNYSEIEKLYYKACYDMLEIKNDESDFTPDGVDALVELLYSYCKMVIDEEIDDHDMYTIMVNSIHRKMKIIQLNKVLKKNIRFKNKDAVIKQYFDFRSKRIFTKEQKDIILDVLLSNSVQSRIYSLNDSYNYANVCFKEVEIAKYEKQIKNYNLSPNSFNMAFEVKPNNCGDIVLVLCNIDYTMINPFTDKMESFIRVIPIYRNPKTNKIAASTCSKVCV